jgi:pimeloyl-ACP methyl ester carboxylesterase
MEVGKMKKEKINNVEIAYERRGKGTPLVLIHGYPLDHAIWNEVAGLLENDFDVILPDLRGFGESTTLETPYGMNEIAEDLAQLLKKLDIKKTMIVGHSMGGYVALAFAHKYPDQVIGLGLVGSQAPSDLPERKEGRYKTAADVEEKGLSVVTPMTDKLSADQKIRDVVRPMIERQSKNGVVGALKAMAEREDARAWLPDFTFPIVLVHGDKDELIPVERAQEIKVAISNAQLVELPGAGHLTMMEMPAKTAEALKLLIK